MSDPYIYEILIRGSASGIAGAHVIRAVDSVNPLTQETRTDIGRAEPVNLSTELTGIIGQATATALSQNADLQAQVAALDNQLDLSNTAASQLQHRVDSLTGELADAVANANGLQAQLKTAMDEIARLTAPPAAVDAPA